MISQFKFINDIDRRIFNKYYALQKQRRRIIEKTYEQYPVDMYGCKADNILDDKLKEIDYIIEHIEKYSKGFQDLIEIVEGEKK